jgi:hypothetical protein
MPSQRTRTTVLLAAGLALAACASTKSGLIESWKAPEAAGPLRFNKVVALAILDNESLRTRAEDALKANLPNVQAVQGYKMFSISELTGLTDLTELKERLRKDGFDGVVLLSLAGSEQKVGWTSTHDPLAEFVWYPTEQIAVDTIIQVEIKIYSLADDKLMWAGISQTFNHKDTNDLISKVAAAAGKELRRQGLIST